MALYTFIMEYKGGTYTSQIKATSPEEACINWAKKLKINDILDFEKIRKNLINQMKSEKPVLLKDLKNAWCASALIQGELALINFVKTEKETDNQQSLTNN